MSKKEKGEIKISISKGYDDQIPEIKNCFSNLNISIKDDYYQKSFGETSMKVFIFLGTSILGGIVYDLIKGGIQKIFKKFKKTEVFIRDKNGIIFNIKRNYKVNVIVVLDRTEEFSHINNLDDLINYLKINHLGWEKIELSKLGEIITGKTPSSRNPKDWGDLMLFVTPTDYKNYRKYSNNAERSLSKDGIERFKNKILPPDSIMVTCIGSDMGKVVMNKEKVITNQQINSIIPNKKIVDNDFLYYSIFSIYEYLRMLGMAGTAVPIVNKGTFEKIKINLPPLPLQKKIAEILSSLDDKIDLLHRQNKTLEEMAGAVFREWFVEGVGEDWEERPLGELVTIKRGGSPRPIHDYLSKKGLKWLKISDATRENSPYIFEIKEHIKKKGLKKTVFLKAGSLVLSNSATPGIPKILQIDSCIHDGWLYFPESYFSREFLYLFFKFIRNNLIQQGSGTIFTNLKTDILKQYPIKLVDEKKLKSFDEKIKPIFDKILFNQKQIRTLEKLRDLLLPKLMSGEVGV
jgi:type I restriction enzyme S subunit